jgi:hypothetical protein
MRHMPVFSSKPPVTEVKMEKAEAYEPLDELPPTALHQAVKLEIGMNKNSVRVPKTDPRYESLSNDYFREYRTITEKETVSLILIC